MTTRIHHIGIVVEDIEKALGVYQSTIGLPLEQIAEEPAEEVQVAFLSAANGDIELIQPTSTDSGIARFLAKRGEGLHHVCFEVESIDAAVSEMAARGMELLGEPRLNERGKKYVFIHPKSANGVLVELYERSEEAG